MGIEPEEVKTKDKADMVHGPVSWKPIDEPWARIPATEHDGGFEKFMNFQRKIPAPIGFDQQITRPEINEGLHYCPVNEERFKIQNEQLMPKNVTKYTAEVVHSFGKQKLPDCEQ